jgi:nitrate/TMAO reductase-like tetraheme cytochrome c subunit
MNWSRRGTPKKTDQEEAQTHRAPLPIVKKKRWLRWPKIEIDFSQPKHRLMVLTLFAGSVVILLALLFSGYKAYEYTESAEFCGTVCHVMDPQFTRYESSEHSNVDCAKCHIGPGADFFVKSKIDGLRQVFAVLTNTVSRPIKSPVHNLRPARETCETCHTPSSFKDNIVKNIVHYDNDKANTRVQSTLILKMGGLQASTGVSQGIHWHINSEVYYIAADEQRQVILWVGVKQQDGTLKEFFARDMLSMAQTSFVEKARAEGKVRQMDCIDCHNRTAHYIPNPSEAVDSAIKNGLIKTSIPYIRKKAIEVLTPTYPSQAEAYTAIDGLADFFKNPIAEAGISDLSNQFVSIPDPEDVQAALTEIKKVYSSIYFPSMNLTWQTNPDNEKHTSSMGCFRCHDDKHVSVDTAGNMVNTIGVECNMCHTVPIIGRGKDLLVEAPVIVGSVPASHAAFSWTIEHRDVTGAAKQECFNCHGQAFCNNGACHNLSHPVNMQFTHPEEYKKRGGQVCYNCHQNILCSRCHPGGIIQNP